MSERVQEWLEQQGCSDHVVRSGAEGLIHAWELSARENAEGWAVTPESFVRALDLRQLILKMEDEGLVDEHEAKRIRLADHLFQGATRTTPECVRGPQAASANGWTAEKNWWYWRWPIEAKA